MASEETLELTIDTLVFGGRGLGRLDDMAVFVPNCAPADRIRCRVERRRKNYLEASLVEILESSNLRRQPPCPLFGECGGCQWQHLEYQHQVAWKERLFREQFERKSLVDSDRVSAICPAPEEWGYRNRVQFKCRQTEQGFVIGFYKPNSHFVVDVKRCLLVRPAIQDTLDLLRRELPLAPAPETVPQVDVSCSDDDTVQLVVHLLPKGQKLMQPWLAEWAASSNLNLSVQVGRKQTLQVLHGETVQKVIVDEPQLTLGVSPGGFAQINAAQNRALVAEVVGLAELTGQEQVLDLFCGVGNFSLPLARRARKLIGVESYAPAIADAERNALINGVQNSQFHADDAVGAVTKYGGPKGFDLVVIDPPRTGSYDVVKDLQRCKPRRVVYVSCDPATLARDLEPLVHDGYRVSFSRPFDLFPQTWHTESVTLLELD